MLVSVIVTTYNQEEKIQKCLESIASQTFKDFEVIIVDDGSIDKTAFVCQEMAKKDSRFHYYYKENQGVSAARNFGLDKVSGEWIGFVDGDDIIPETMIETLLNNAIQSQCKISCCDIIKVYKQDFSSVMENQGRPTEFIKEKMVLENEPLWSWFYDRYHAFVFWSVCNKLFHSSLIEALRFDTKYNMGEDLLFVFLALKESKKMVLDPTVCYGYVIYEKSGSHSVGFHPSRVQSIQISQYMEKELAADSELKEYVHFAKDSTVYQMLTYIADYQRNRPIKQKEYTDLFRDYRYQLITDYRGCAAQKKRWFFSLIPISITIRDLISIYWI